MIALISTITVITVAMTGAEEDTQPTGWGFQAQTWVIFLSSGLWDRVQLEWGRAQGIVEADSPGFSFWELELDPEKSSGGWTR